MAYSLLGFSQYSSGPTISVFIKEYEALVVSLPSYFSYLLPCDYVFVFQVKINIKGM